MVAAIKLSIVKRKNVPKGLVNFKNKCVISEGINNIYFSLFCWFFLATIDSTIRPSTHPLATIITDVPSTASKITTTLVSSPIVSKMLLATNITQYFTTTPGKTKKLTTTQPFGTTTTDIPPTVSKTTTTLVSSPTASRILLATSITQEFTTTPRKTKTVTITQSLGTTTTDISSTTATLVSSPTVSKILLATSITKDITTTAGITKTVTTSQSHGTTTTDTLSTAFKKNYILVSSPKISKIIMETSITQDFTTTPGNTKTKKTTQSLGTATTDIPSTAYKTKTTLVSSPTASKIFPNIMVPKGCSSTVVFAKAVLEKVGKVAAILLIDPLIGLLKEEWMIKIAELIKG